MYHRILVPTDGTPGSKRAVRNALDIAAKYGATVDAVSVVDHGPLGRDGSRDERRERAEAALADAAAEAEDSGVELRTELLEGKVSDAVLSYIDDGDVDLVVMGTHGRQGFSRFLVGSVSERIVREADVPVMTVSLGTDTVRVTSVEEAHAVARDALAAREFESVDIESGAYDERSAYVVQAVADGQRFNIHVEKATGDAHLVSLGDA